MSKLSKQLKQQELLKHFDGDSYQEKFVNNKWLVKWFNRGLDRWIVSEYSDASFQRRNEYKANKERFEYLINKE